MFVVNIWNWKQLRHKNALTLNSIECSQSWQAWSPLWYIYIVLGSLVQASWRTNLVNTLKTLQVVVDLKNLHVTFFLIHMYLKQVYIWLFKL